MEISVNLENQLNDLLAKSYDAQRGYANAAEAAENVQLKRWFAQQGARRTEFAAALATELKLSNRTPEFDGTFAGDVHRGWMNLKAALSSNKDESILEECLRGERAAIEEYDKVLEHQAELAPTLVSIVEAQRDEIEATLNTVKSLENIAQHHS